MTVVTHKISGVRYWVITLTESGLIDRGCLAVGGPSPSLCTVVGIDGGAQVAGAFGEVRVGYMVSWVRPLVVATGSKSVRLILAEGAR